MADAGFDLDAERAVGLLQVKRRPVPGAQPPLRLKRHRHHLLDQLAADRVKDERGAEEALGQASGDGAN